MLRQLLSPLLLALAFVFLLATGVAQAAPVVGIGEQEPGALVGPNFTSLGIGQVRVTVPWDEPVKHPLRLDARMNGYKALGLRPLIVFSGSYDPRRAKILPTVPYYRQMVVNFRKRYPWVDQFASWNEVNHHGQPSMHSPARVAGFYRTLRQVCPGCLVLVATVLDTENMASYTKSLIRYLGNSPQLVWGLHNYGDVKARHDRQTKSFLALVRGRVWLTETGHLVHYRGGNQRLRKAKFSEQLQTRSMNYLLNKLLIGKPRIERVYLYHWQTGAKSPWDSGLIRPNGQPRPAYYLVRQAIKQGRLRTR